MNLEHPIREYSTDHLRRLYEADLTNPLTPAADLAAYRREFARRAADRAELYTPAAGDADQYNEHGQPVGYVNRSAG